MGAPLVMPPWTPPELLVRVVRRGGAVEEVEELEEEWPLVVGGAVSVEALTPDWEGGMAGAVMKASLWMEPGMVQPWKPEPISKPLVAGMLSIAPARQASNFSKQGSPRPMGTLRITQVTVPPMLSFLSRYSAILDAMRSKASLFGQRTGMKESTSSRVMVLRRER